MMEKRHKTEFRTFQTVSPALNWCKDISNCFTRIVTVSKILRICDWYWHSWLGANKPKRYLRKKERQKKAPLVGKRAETLWKAECFLISQDCSRREFQCFQNETFNPRWYIIYLLYQGRRLRQWKRLNLQQLLGKPFMAQARTSCWGAAPFCLHPAWLFCMWSAQWLCQHSIFRGSDKAGMGSKRRQCVRNCRGCDVAMHETCCSRSVKLISSQDHISITGSPQSTDRKTE